MMKNDKKIIDCSVVGATSEVPEHPLYSIISNEKKEGRCSSPFCKYPQEVIIQLNKPSKLSQINLTLHESKIPTKIDFYYFYPEQKKEKGKNKKESFDLNNIPFLKLGFITPNSNQKTNFKAREFQKIKINQNVFFIKFVLHKNHINLENKYNQVSIISVEFFGNEIENFSDFHKYSNINMSNNKEIANKQKYNDEDLDEVCLSKLKEIKITLDLCVQKEKYESAKIFRELYQRVRLLGEKMKNLSDSKLKCIEINDFDSCKKLQGDIDRIKKLINDINTNFPENDENEENENDSPFK
jgi:centrosomal protein CEP104